MDLATLQVPRQKAREEFLAYKRAIAQGRADELTAEDKALMDGYGQIARGKPIISLHDIMVDGGFEFHRPQKAWLPKLAVCRADQTEVQVECGPHMTLFEWGPGYSRDRRLKRSRWQVRVHVNGQGRVAQDGSGNVFQTATMSATAKVPSVPIALRPKGLDRYHIMWEADWDLPAPRDPALLKPLGRGLYAVVAVWELTELERTVLAMR